MAALLDAGADAGAQGTAGWTPLLLAARHGRGPVVTLLLQRGADPATQDRRGWTALHYAAEVNITPGFTLLQQPRVPAKPK